MPLVRITGSHEPATLRLIGDAVHDALVAAVGIPPDDRFQILDRVPEDATVADRNFLDVARERPLFVEITLRAGRSVGVKRALYRAVADGAHARAGVRPEDVTIVLHENSTADWSFGNGVAQYQPE
jgi:phenylpyruvate tautomerase PptA (4-oxalocrotonate tautomerase family)